MSRQYIYFYHAKVSNTNIEFNGIAELVEQITPYSFESLVDQLINALLTNQNVSFTRQEIMITSLSFLHEKALKEE